MEERFYFEPGFSLHSISPGDGVRLLSRISDHFGVGTVARDHWVEISGEAEAVAQASEFFSSLQKLFNFRRKELEKADIELLFRSFSVSGPPDLENLWQGRVPVGLRKKEVLPRSKRQLEYLNAMRRNEVVFGIGPAGTGKTYLAMAMAVSMFLSSSPSATKATVLRDSRLRRSTASRERSVSKKRLSKESVYTSMPGKNSML